MLNSVTKDDMFPNGLTKDMYYIVFIQYIPRDFSNYNLIKHIFDLLLISWQIKTKFSLLKRQRQHDINRYNLYMFYEKVKARVKVSSIKHNFIHKRNKL
jgi:hypothetical protein